LIGNARAVTVTVNDQDLGELGGSGEVVEVSCRIGASACDITRF
jgi:hypothetical protein